MGKVKFIEQGDESRFALEQYKGVEIGNSYTGELGELFTDPCKQKRLLVDGQQDIVSLLLEQTNQKLEILEWMRSPGGTAVESVHEARKAADTPRIGVTHINGVALPPESRKSFSC